MMMNNVDDNLDLLDLDDDAVLDTLPEVNPFSQPRPKRPWLLLGIGLLVIVLATYIIIRVVGNDSSSSIDIDLDAPDVITIDPTAGTAATDTLVVPPQDTIPATVVTTPAKPASRPEPVSGVQPRPDHTAGAPVREIGDRADVTFNPNKTTPKTDVKPVQKNTTKPKAQPSKVGTWYVQFGSYSTRASAESGLKSIKAKHTNLLQEKQFVILAAVLPNGTTTYRLRIAFANSSDANGFCRNAKSDGLDCYVAK